MERAASYRTYWTAWGILLILTVLMLSVEAARLPRAAIVVFLVSAMLAKATLIGGWFMHLRFERVALVVSVVGAVLATAMFLFFLTAPDGVSMLRLAPR